MTNSERAMIKWTFVSELPDDHFPLARAVKQYLVPIQQFLTAVGHEYEPYVSPDEVRKTAWFLYDKLQDNPGIITQSRWNKWVYSPELMQTYPGQQILVPPEQLLETPKGTCIDWVLLLASVLQGAGIRTLVVVTGRGDRNKPEARHAILAYWLYECMLPRPGIWSGEQFLKEVRELSQEIGSKKLLGVLNAASIPPDEKRHRAPGAEASERDALRWLSSDVRTYCLDPPSDRLETDAIAPTQSANDEWISTALDVYTAKEELLRRSLLHGGHDLPPIKHYQTRIAEETGLTNWYDRWWSASPGARVFLLIGEGGAGKTALARRLQELLLESETKLPDWFFVWRFEADDLASNCVMAMEHALVKRAHITPHPVSGFLRVKELLLHLEESRGDSHCLLVLDGFERLLEPPRDAGSRRVSNGARHLKELLTWCCNAETPLRILVTSKYGVADLDDYVSQGRCRTVQVGELTVEQALSLLRSHQVEGSRDDLTEVTVRVGKLPVVLNAAAVALHRFCNGNARRIDEIVGKHPSEPLSEVLDYYERELNDRSPRTLGVFRLLTLFSSDRVSISTLEATSKHVGITARAAGGNIEEELHRLVREYQLAVRSLSNEEPVYGAHASLKHYFRESEKFADRREWQEAIVKYLRRAATRLREPPVERDITRLSELVFQLNALGRPRNAYNVYMKRMSARRARFRKEGPYDLLTRSNLLSLGLRTIETILSADTHCSKAADRLRPWQRARLLNDKGGFERDLGALETSHTSYNDALVAVDEAPRWWHFVPLVRGKLILNKSFALRNPARTLIHQGLLEQGYQAATVSLDHERRVRDREGQQISLCLQARARGLKGKVDEAQELYRAAARSLGRRRQGRLYTKGYSARWAHLLMRAGRTDDAEQLVGRTMEERLRPSDYVRQMCELLEVHANQNDNWEEVLQRIRGEAMDNRRTELAIWCDLSLGRFALEWLQQQRWTSDQERHALIATGRGAVDAGLSLTDAYGYALYWIDLRFAEGMLHLEDAARLAASADLDGATGATWTAWSSALCALNGQEQDGNASPTPDTPRATLRRIGAAHEDCGYAWGKVNGLLLKKRVLESGHGPRDLVEAEGDSLGQIVREEADLRAQLQAAERRRSVPPTIS